MDLAKELESVMFDLKTRRELEEEKRDEFVVERKFASAGNQEMIATGMLIAEMIVRHHHMDQFRGLADHLKTEVSNAAVTGGESEA